MRICITGGNSSEEAEAIASALEAKEYQAYTSICVVRPNDDMDAFLTEIEACELLVVVLDGASVEPWLIVLVGILNRGKIVLALSKTPLSPGELSLSEEIPGGFRIENYTDVAQAAGFVIPFFLADLKCKKWPTSIALLGK